MAESLLDQAVGWVSERTGLTVERTDRVEQLREFEVEATRWQNEAEALAIRTMDYFGGRPQEMVPERRKRIAQRARIAFLTDPLAGREVELTADFVLGRGVPKPTSRNKAVQRIIDEVWDDPVNQENLTSYDAQRAIINDLKTQANLFVLMFERAGKVRFDFLDHDAVLNIVTDPEARRRALWYLAEERRYEWDFGQDRAKLSPQWEDGRLKRRYYQHWRNVDIAEEERSGRNEDPLETPDEKKLGDGKVYHVRTNRLGESLFGIPPFYRSLRFLTAMNQFVESRVAMAQAQASFIARRSVDGTPKTLMRQAGRLLSQVGELGTARIEGGQMEGVGAQGPPQTVQQGPVPPGSFLYENMGMKTEPLSLSSNAADAQANAQVIRGQWSAASGLGQHLAGDPSSTNLATATTLELPVTMMIQAWQQLVSGIFEWMIDRAIEAAVAAGRLGGTGTSPGDRSLQEFRLWESVAVEDFQTEQGQDLSYEFQMPFPGRRLGRDVGTLILDTLTAFDPDGMNIPLRKALLTYLLQQGFEVADPDRIVNDAYPDEQPGQRQPFQNGMIPPALAQLLGLRPGQQGGAGGGGPGGPGDANPSVYGEARKAAQPNTVKGIVRAELAELLAEAAQEDGATVAAFVPEDLRAQVERYVAANDGAFDAAVTEPSRAAAANGAGS